MNTILITGPRLSGEGGVANFYSHVLPELQQVVQREFLIEYLEIGAAIRRNRVLGPISDQRRFSTCLKRNRNIGLVQVNPSLNLKCSLRDGFFVWQAKRLGLPVVVFFRGWDPGFEEKVRTTYLPYFRRTLLRADAIIVLGSVFENTIRAWGFEGPIYRMTTVVDSKIIDIERIEAISSSGEISLLFLSRLELGKGILDLLEAVDILRVRGRAVKLTVAGDGIARQQVESWLGQHPAAASQVCLMGFVRGNEKLDLLASHDVFVLPTYREGLPNAVLEAMAAGLVIVTCDAGAINEVVVENENGFFVHQQSPVEIADIIEMISGNRARLREISERNRRVASQRFSVQSVSRRLGDVYRSVLTAR